MAATALHLENQTLLSTFQPQTASLGIPNPDFKVTTTKNTMFFCFLLVFCFFCTSNYFAKYLEKGWGASKMGER